MQFVERRCPEEAKELLARLTWAPAATSMSAVWMDSGEMTKLLPMPVAARMPTSLARHSWLDAFPPASLPTIFGLPGLLFSP
jgi:hypothetical protein